jgi:hypothetical protein
MKGVNFRAATRGQFSPGVDNRSRVPRSLRTQGLSHQIIEDLSYQVPTAPNAE